MTIEVETPVDTKGTPPADRLEKIDFNGLDGHAYVVVAIPWLKKNRIYRKHTKANPATGVITFDDENYTIEIYEACVTKDGKPLTKADIEALDPKTGDILEQAVNLVNFVSAAETKNLSWRQS